LSRTSISPLSCGSGCIFLHHGFDSLMADLLYFFTPELPAFSAPVGLECHQPPSLNK